MLFVRRGLCHKKRSDKLMKPCTGFELEARSAMLEKGISVTELAKTLGITQQYLSDIFGGARKATKQKKKIADILQIDFQ